MSRWRVGDLATQGQLINKRLKNGDAKTLPTLCSADAPQDVLPGITHLAVIGDLAYRAKARSNRSCANGLSEYTRHKVIVGAAIPSALRPRDIQRKKLPLRTPEVL